MTEGPIIQAGVVVFLRARHLTANGRNHSSEERDIASQRQLCRQAAEQIDAVIVREYVEHGGTGPIAKRPIVRQLIGDLGTLLGVRYVLVAHPDRIARRPSDALAITEAIQAAGAHLVTAGDLPSAYRRNPSESFLGLTSTNDQLPRTKGGSR
jgi:hypothetical protein